MFLVVISEKKTTKHKNNTRHAKLPRAFDRLDLSTGEYTPLCYVPEHCFNACGISPETNEIFCREKCLNIAVFDGKGRDEIGVGLGFSWFGRMPFVMDRNIWRFFFQKEFLNLCAAGGFYKGGWFQ